ncbi:MAG: S-layer homology domain-containing protein, partial [Clostridia bacterium]|nr:S-layer homology domain-containing protein [Clostridia bacterium]
MKGKRILSFGLCAVMALSVMPVSANVIFNDIDASHWAYAPVMELVEDGTVVGYDDGGFHPDGTVTRAEFSKMIGIGPEIRETDYDDVNKEHWGYDYIMSSGLITEGNSFLPDKPILRGEVIEMIWARNGKPEGMVAPGAVIDGWKNKSAVAWGYSYGIMIGDDGLNLRLNEPLTRAEAATLIIRGRNYSSAAKIDFENTVSEDLVRLILNQTDLVDGDLSDLSREITNGELAMATMRLEVGENEPLLLGYPSDAEKCKFGKEWAFVATNYLGSDSYSKSDVEKVAVLGDAFAALAMATVGKSNTGIDLDNLGYPGIDATGNKMFALKFAKGLGLEFNSNGTLDYNRKLTLGDLGKILLQIDECVGIKVSYVNSTKQDEKILKLFTNYPNNADNYPVILESVPKEVYEIAWDLSDGVHDYEFTRSFPTIFTDVLEKFSALYNSEGIYLTYTYYPSLAIKNNEAYASFRVYMDVLSAPKEATFKSVFVDKFIGEDAEFKSGYIEIKTA